MKGLLLGATSLTIAAGLVANATVITTSVGLNLPWNVPAPGLDVNVVWDLTACPPTPVGPLTYWSASITPTFSIPGPTVGFTVTGQHMVNPHPGDSLIPPPVFVGGAVFPNVLGANGLSEGTVMHVGAAHGPADFWRVTAMLVPYNPLDFMGAPGPSGLQANINIRAWHVPEPGSYALVAGLGLVGFAAFRRIRD